MASPKDATTTTAVAGTTAVASEVFPEDASGEVPEIPIRIALGGAAMSMDASGQWELEHSTLHEYMAQVDKLKAHNEQLEHENATLRERCTRLTEESNMDKFKCQLLVEMLALSSLDEERSRGEAEQERARVTSMKNDLLALMEQARKQGVDVRKIAASLPVP